LWIVAHLAGSPGQKVLALAHAAGAAAAMASSMGQQVAQQVNASAATAATWCRA